MKIKIINSADLFNPRINPKMKMSASAAMLLAEITDGPGFGENRIVELVRGVTGEVRLKFIDSWLKLGGNGADTPAAFLSALGFRGDRLTERSSSI